MRFDLEAIEMAAFQKTDSHMQSLDALLVSLGLEKNPTCLMQDFRQLVLEIY